MEMQPKIEEKTTINYFCDLVETALSTSSFESDKQLQEILDELLKEEECEEINEQFLKLFEANKEEILSEKLHFIIEEKTQIKYKDKIFDLPLIYSTIVVKHDDFVDTMDAFLYFIFRSVCPKSDQEKMEKICSSYEENDNHSLNSIIGNVIEKVSNGLSGKKIQNEDGTINTESIEGMVQELLSDGGIFNGLTNFAQAMSKNGMINPNEIFGQKKSNK